MRNETMRKLVATIGCIIVFLVVACIIAGSFLLGGNTQEIFIPDYVRVEKDMDGNYLFELDVEELLYREHLPMPPAGCEGEFPESDALRTLSVYVTQSGDNYIFETVSTSSDADFTKNLRKNGIVLKSTTWTWSSIETETKYSEQRGGSLKLTFADYLLLQRAQDGSYQVSVDTMRLLYDCGFYLPEDPNTHSGYVAIMSLGVACSAEQGGYVLQATSTLSDIATRLEQNGVQIVDTVLHWTEQEMQARLAAQAAKTPVPTFAPAETATEAPTDVPETSPSEAPQTEIPVSPSPTPNHTDCIVTLYGFDQTDVRVRIRDAKEALYGSRLDGSEVIANVFAVGTDTTEHGNCFRIVYRIDTSDGTEYLVCDAYDLTEQNKGGKGEIRTQTFQKATEAKKTDDLNGWLLYPLEGGSMVFEQNVGKSPFDEDGLVQAESVERELSYRELWEIPQTEDLTLLQLLGFARNEMFARAGHPFAESGSYYKHFSSYDWYEAGDKVSATDLAEIWPKTAKNITTIKFLEKLIKEG